MKVSVVIPCYRSERTLEECVQQLTLELASSPSDAPGIEAFEIVLVVDGSPDRTGEIAQSLAQSNPRVRALELMRNYGQHNALLAGIMAARHEVIVTMDDDLQHHASDVRKLLAALDEQRVDLVYGVAAREEHAFLRSLASRGVKRGLAMMGVANASDISAFRAFRSELREAMQITHDPHISIDVLLSWATTREARVVVDMDRRAEGVSGYRFSTLVRHSLNMVTGYTTTPLRFVTLLGMAAAVAGLLLLVYVLVGYTTGFITAVGYTSIIAAIALFSGTQLISLGIFGEYLARIHERAMRRPSYLIRHDSFDDFRQ